MRRCRLSEKRGRHLVLSPRGQGNRRDQCVVVLHLGTAHNADHPTRPGGVRPNDMGRDVRRTQATAASEEERFRPARIQ